MDFKVRFLSLARQDLGDSCPDDVPSAAHALWERRASRNNLLPFDRRINHPDEGYDDMRNCTLMHPAGLDGELSIWLCGQSERESPGSNYPVVVGIVEGAARFAPLLPMRDSF